MLRPLRLPRLALLPLLVACAAHGAPERAPAAGGATQERSVPARTHEGADPHDHGLPATSGAGFTVADVRFMQMMIGHHAQAVTMAGLAADRGASGPILELARKIDISQRDEIEMMRSWLVERGQAVPDDAQLHGMRMPGMVSSEQLARLAAARGAAFDRLFLELMIQHHEGAVEMVDALFASPGAGQDPDLFRFVTDVSADQLDEIGAMRYLLEQLPRNPGSVRT